MRKMKVYLTGFLSCLIFLSSCCDCPPKPESTTTTAGQSTAASNAVMTTADDKCACLKQAACASPTSYCQDGCKDKILECHKITQAEFDAIIKGFSRTGRLISNDTIMHRLAGGSCTTTWLELDGDHANTTSNADIKITKKTVTSAELLATVKYEYQLFSIIMSRNPECVVFYKGRRLDCSQKMSDDIVFKVMYNADSTRFYDLSDSPPIL